MHARYFPPTRRSIWATGAVKSFGPHHFLKCSGSVHAFHTSARGASNTRVITRSCPVRAAVSVALFVAMFLLLVFQLVQVLVQPIEPFLPDLSITLHPVDHVPQRLRLESA